MKTVRSIAVLVALLLPLGCSLPAPTKLACAVTEDGFAPKRVTERGIGGTGAPARLADRGIGGTGAKTGVQGIISGFASICVNGLELDYDPADPVDVDGTPQVARDLRIGQMVTLRAEAASAGFVARAISVSHAVSGPIDAIANGGTTLVVAGQDVRLGANSPGAAGLRTGQWVAVSGLRDPAGFIVATRIDPRPPGEVIITGRIVITDGIARIGGTRLRGDVPDVASAEAVSLTGAYNNGVLAVRRRVATAIPLPLGQSGLVVVEAIARQTRTLAGRPMLQIGDDRIAALGPNFGEIPATTTLMVLVLEQSESGELTALSHHDGSREGGGGPSPALATLAATANGLAPHATSTTAVGAARASGSVNSGKTDGATTATSSAVGHQGVGNSSTGGAGSVGATGSGSATGGAATGGSTGAGSGSGGPGGSGTGSGGPGSGGTGNSGPGSSGTGSGGPGSGGPGSGGAGGHGAAAPAAK